MKVGDMVQYVDHDTWENSGLGVITDINRDRPRTDEPTFQIAWLDDIEDYGWDEAIRDWAQWYDEQDMKEDIQLFVEAT